MRSGSIPRGRRSTVGAHHSSPVKPLSEPVEATPPSTLSVATGVAQYMLESGVGKPVGLLNGEDGGMVSPTNDADRVSLDPNVYGAVRLSSSMQEDLISGNGVIRVLHAILLASLENDSVTLMRRKQSVLRMSGASSATLGEERQRHRKQELVDTMGDYLAAYEDERLGLLEHQQARQKSGANPGFDAQLKYMQDEAQDRNMAARNRHERWLAIANWVEEMTAMEVSPESLERILCGEPQPCLGVVVATLQQLHPSLFVQQTEVMGQAAQKTFEQHRIERKKEREAELERQRLQSLIPSDPVDAIDQLATPQRLAIERSVASYATKANAPAYTSVRYGNSSAGSPLPHQGTDRQAMSIDRTYSFDRVESIVTSPLASPSHAQYDSYGSPTQSVAPPGSDNNHYPPDRQQQRRLSKQNSSLSPKSNDSPSGRRDSMPQMVFSREDYGTKSRRQIIEETKAEREASYTHNSSNRRTSSVVQASQSPPRQQAKAPPVQYQQRAQSLVERRRSQVAEASQNRQRYHEEPQSYIEQSSHQWSRSSEDFRSGSRPPGYGGPGEDNGSLALGKAEAVRVLLDHRNELRSYTSTTPTDPLAEIRMVRNGGGEPGAVSRFSKVLLQHYILRVERIQAFVRFARSAIEMDDRRHFYRCVLLIQARWRLVVHRQRRRARHLHSPERVPPYAMLCQTHRCQPILEVLEARIFAAPGGKLSPSATWRYLQLLCPNCLAAADHMLNRKPPSIMLSSTSQDETKASDKPAWMTWLTDEPSATSDKSSGYVTGSERSRSIVAVQAALRARSAQLIIFRRHYTETAGNYFIGATHMTWFHFALLVMKAAGKFKRKSASLRAAQAAKNAEVTSCARCGPLLLTYRKALSVDSSDGTHERFKQMVCKNCVSVADSLLGAKLCHAQHQFRAAILAVAALVKMWPGLGGPSRFPISHSFAARLARRRVRGNADRFDFMYGDPAARAMQGRIDSGLGPVGTGAVVHVAKVIYGGAALPLHCIPADKELPEGVCRRCWPIVAAYAQRRAHLVLSEGLRVAAEIMQACQTRWDSVLCSDCRGDRQGSGAPSFLTVEIIPLVDSFERRVHMTQLRAASRLWFKVRANRRFGSWEALWKSGKAPWCWGCHTTMLLISRPAAMRKASVSSFTAIDSTVDRIMGGMTGQDYDPQLHPHVCVGKAKEFLRKHLTDRNIRRFFVLTMLYTQIRQKALRARFAALTRRFEPTNELGKLFAKPAPLCSRCRVIADALYNRMLFLVGGTEVKVTLSDADVKKPVSAIITEHAKKPFEDESSLLLREALSSNFRDALCAADPESTSDKNCLQTCIAAIDRFCAMRLGRRIRVLQAELRSRALNSAPSHEKVKPKCKEGLFDKCKAEFDPLVKKMREAAAGRRDPSTLLPEQTTKRFCKPCQDELQTFATRMKAQVGIDDMLDKAADASSQV